MVVGQGQQQVSGLTVLQSAGLILIELDGPHHAIYLVQHHPALPVCHLPRRILLHFASLLAQLHLLLEQVHLCRHRHRITSADRDADLVCIPGTPCSHLGADANQLFVQRWCTWCAHRHLHQLCLPSISKHAQENVSHTLSEQNLAWYTPSTSDAAMLQRAARCA